MEPYRCVHYCISNDINQTQALIVIKQIKQTKGYAT